MATTVVSIRCYGYAEGDGIGDGDGSVDGDGNAVYCGMMGRLLDSLSRGCRRRWY